MNRSCALLILLALTLSAGCVEQANLENTTLSEGTNSTSVGTPGESTITFRELNTTQQAAFLDALNGNARFVPIDASYLNSTNAYTTRYLGPFVNNNYMCYKNEGYEINITRGKPFATYTIRTAAEKPHTNSTVVAFEDLPDSLREEMKVAITEGEYRSPPGKWGSLPDSLSGVNYVQYENSSYRMRISVGDGREIVMTVEKNGSQGC